MIEKSLKILISLLVVSFIVIIGFQEIHEYRKNHDYMVFYSQMRKVIDTIHYLYSSNLWGSFVQKKIIVPENQTVVFNNLTDSVELDGFYNEDVNTSIDILNRLVLEKGSYVITLCYDCTTNNSYVVRFV